MSEEELQTELLKAAQRFSKINFGNLFKDISHGEFRMLMVLKNHKEKHPELRGINVSEIAKNRRTSSPAVSRMLRSLEMKGWVKREVDITDRRNTYVLLTKAGELKCSESTRIMDQFSMSVITKMGKEKTGALICLWNELADAMIESMNE